MTPDSPLRIAMIGQRGVPATWGGIEHHVEEIGARLADRGHDVTVFCRTNYSNERLPIYRGMRLRHFPTLGTKHFDAISHSAFSTVAALFGRFDVVHYHALGPGLLAPLPRVFSRAKVVQTIHGLDSERAKWGAVATAVLRAAGWSSGHVPDATIGVSRDLKAHYAERWKRVIDYIPNGVASLERRDPDEIMTRWGLAKGTYILFVARLVPEKAPDLLLRAFKALDADLRLVIAGGSSYSADYERSIAALAADDNRVLMTGYVYGDALAELYSNAAAFVLPSSLEGLPLTLLEAAAYGTPVVASDIPPHLEILSSSGAGHRLFRSGDQQALTQTLSTVLQDPAAEREGAAKLRDQVLRDYDWDAAADATESVYERVLAAGRVPR